MALQLINVDVNDRGGVAIVQADSQEEVMSSAARQFAINAGQRAGLVKCGTSGGESAYPVNAAGETNDDVVFGRNGQSVAGYRCDFRLTASM